MQVVTGEIGADEIEDVIRDYEENLAVVLPYIEGLLTELGGKTVVTSDHGNLLGERTSPIPVRDWGHPLSLYAEELVSVPWVTFENGERRQVIAEAYEPDQRATTDEIVEERLKQLGYK
jgi:hypothetical protein